MGKLNACGLLHNFLLWRLIGAKLDEATIVFV
jgi:hypothetical protein